MALVVETTDVWGAWSGLKLRLLSSSSVLKETSLFASFDSSSSAAVPVIEEEAVAVGYCWVAIVDEVVLLELSPNNDLSASVFSGVDLGGAPNKGVSPF